MKKEKRGQDETARKTSEKVGAGPGIRAGDVTLKLQLERWKGVCGRSLVELRYDSVDEFIEDIRGR
jgi:hypothetical protein